MNFPSGGHNPRIDELLAKMSIDEKVTLCHAASKFAVGALPQYGIPEFGMSDGPHGVRREISRDSWDAVGGEGDLATYLPTGTALTATWNPDLARKSGEVLGAEARERGKDIILGPGINIVRSPLCGRNFEYYSEDPHLICKMVVPAIQGIQSQGTAACVKHFALNSQELNRNGVNALPDERTLREIYLPGFEAAIREGGCLTLMGAYNLFRGQHCCQHDYLLNHILKGEWGFEGLVVSDWAGVHDTYEGARHGMDIEMGTNPPYENYFLAKPFADAVKNGEIEEAVLDDKVRRILRVMFAIGMFSPDRPAGARNIPAHQQAALDVAREALVLLKNEGGLLPLDASKVKNLLVVGENAIMKHHAGGASSAVNALYEVTPLEGLQKLLGAAVKITYLQGYPADHGEGSPLPCEHLSLADKGAGVNGWVVKYFHGRYHNDGVAATAAQTDSVLDWSKPLPGGLSPKTSSLLMETVFTAPVSGTCSFILHGASHGCICIDDKALSMRWENDGPQRVAVDYELRQGQQYKICVPVQPNTVVDGTRVTLRWVAPDQHNDQGLSALLDAAKTADAVLFFGGLNHQLDTEGADRADLSLPGGQNEVIAALARVTKKLAVVLAGGSPAELPWLDAVPAAVWMWYAGMECGTAAAEILFGKVNPSGKLPFTFPARLVDSPAHALNDYDEKVCYYKEGIFVGYRWFDRKNIAPLFPFGHGLSYTTFSAKIRRVENLFGHGARVEATVRNTGTVAGAEVFQLYIGALQPALPRPVKELKGFRKVFLQPGEEQTLVYELTGRDFSYFHPVNRAWTEEPGEYRLCLSTSAATAYDETVFRYGW